MEERFFGQPKKMEKKKKKTWFSGVVPGSSIELAHFSIKFSLLFPYELEPILIYIFFSRF